MPNKKILRVRCYVDGLNFYKSISFHLNFKWIDLVGLLNDVVGRKFSDNKVEIEKLTIFSSAEKGKKQRMRRDKYLNALRAHAPCVELVDGGFKSEERTGKVITEDSQCIGDTVKISTFTEKQTDVNLACRMIEDAYRENSSKTRNFDMACLVSNDSDFKYVFEAVPRMGVEFLWVSPILLTGDRDTDRERLNSRLSTTLKQSLGGSYGIEGIQGALVRKHPLPAVVKGLDESGNPVDFTPPEARGWGLSK